MQILSTLVVIALAACGLALPDTPRAENASTAEDMSSQAGPCSVSVTYCKNDHFHPDCNTVRVPGGGCVAVAPGYNDVVSSWASSFYCQLFRDYNCAGPSIHSSYAEDLRTLGFNDMMSSFRCGCP